MQRTSMEKFDTPMPVAASVKLVWKKWCFARSTKAVWKGTSPSCGSVSASAPSSEIVCRSWKAVRSGFTGVPTEMLKLTGSRFGQLK